MVSTRTVQFLYKQAIPRPFSIRLAKSQDEPHIMHFIRENFYDEEPLIKSLNINKSLANPCLEEYLCNHLKAGSVSRNAISLFVLLTFLYRLRIYFTCRGEGQPNRGYIRQSTKLRLGWRQITRACWSSSMRPSAKAFLHLVHCIEGTSTTSKVQNAVYLRGKLLSFNICMPHCLSTCAKALRWGSSA